MSVRKSRYIKLVPKLKGITKKKNPPVTYKEVVQRMIPKRVIIIEDDESWDDRDTVVESDEELIMDVFISEHL